jgi:hypothetical protein
MSNGRIIDKLRKVLALTNSPEEGEAQAAAETLQRLLTEYNLSMADLEQRGQDKPGVEEKAHDLGKAAFQWKLDLAEVMAEHYYCWPLIDRKTKTVKFVGRPDNVDSFQLLYGWVIDQIKRIASEERQRHLAETAEHVDPLRWQLHFGLGCVSRLSTRLREMKERESTSTVTALVLSHKTEISDFMEQKYGVRIDGKRTKADEKWRAEYEERQRTKAELKERDIEAYYRAYPWERPLTPEQQAAQQKANEEWERKEARKARRRTGRAPRGMSDAEYRREEQAYTANRAGRSAGDRVNLQPFIDGQKKEDKKLA